MKKEEIRDKITKVAKLVDCLYDEYQLTNNIYAQDSQGFLKVFRELSTEISEFQSSMNKQDPLLEERRKILEQKTLTEANEQRLGEIREAVAALPFASTEWDMKAMELIHKFALQLKVDNGN